MQLLDHFGPPADVPPAFASLDEPAERQDVVDRFHYLYYHATRQTWLDTWWLGTHVQKCPLDLWIYQEILFELRPDVIIECGTYQGGSALFLATVCDLLDCGRIYSIDVARQPGCPVHPRIEYISGSSTSATTLEMIRQRLQPGERPLVILDSDHSYAHVRAELEAYAPLVPPGGYLIVEDTNINGHPAHRAFGPGPMEALTEFLGAHAEFESDTAREKLFLTFNPRGYLRRTGSSWTTETEQQARAGRAATATLNAALAANREQIAAHQAQIGVLRDYIDTHEREVTRYVASLRETLANREAELTAMRASWLWRLGAWFRSLRG